MNEIEKQQESDRKFKNFAIIIFVILVLITLIFKLNSL